jgi:hypothetical protein
MFLPNALHGWGQRLLKQVLSQWDSIAVGAGEEVWQRFFVEHSFAL